MSDFANFTGFPVSKVQAWCNGVNSPAPTALFPLAEQLSRWLDREISVTEIAQRIAGVVPDQDSKIPLSAAKN